MVEGAAFFYSSVDVVRSWILNFSPAKKEKATRESVSLADEIVIGHSEISDQSSAIQY